MKNKKTDFPQYRLLANGKTCYKITNAHEFEEIQRVGRKFNYFRMVATQYPEMVRIQEMLEAPAEIYTKVGAEEWISFWEQMERSK